MNTNSKLFELPTNHDPRAYLEAGLYYSFGVYGPTQAQIARAVTQGIEAAVDLFEVPTISGTPTQRFTELLRPSLVNPMAITLKSAAQYLDRALKASGQKRPTPGLLDEFE